jgi:hypothetical protein
MCRFQICAVGLNRKGLPIFRTNTPRFPSKGGGLHAEARIMAEYGELVHTILIVRVNRRGDLRPIHPCPQCQKLADRLGIRILPIQPEMFAEGTA